MAATPQKLDLEASMQALEKLVTQMESGDLSLDESLAAFEKGIKLSKQCQAALEKAEQKVQVLLQKDASQTLADFDDTPPDDPKQGITQDDTNNDSLF